MEWKRAAKKTKGYRKNATLDNERSSRMVREEAKMFRRTAGVTGMRLEGLSGEGERGARADGWEGVTVRFDLGAVTVEEEEERLLMVGQGRAMVKRYSTEAQ